jgi:hypothetical protein
MWRSTVTLVAASVSPQPIASDQISTATVVDGMRFIYLTQAANVDLCPIGTLWNVPLPSSTSTSGRAILAQSLPKSEMELLV